MTNSISINNLIDISIIVPAHNAENTIIRCLDSITDIKNYNYEIIIICNNCYDNTLKLVQKFILNNNNIEIKLIVNNQINNASSARNIGIDKARGKYISFMDADDYLITTNFENSLKILIEIYDIDLVVGSHIIFNIKGMELRRHGLENSEILNTHSIQKYLRKYCFAPYIYTLFVHCWGKIYCTDTIKKNKIEFDINLDQLEDVKFNLTYLNYCSQIYYNDEAIYYYDTNINPNSMSSKSGTEYKPIKRIILALLPLKILLNKNYSKYESKILISNLITSISRIWIIRISKNFKLDRKSAKECIINILRSREYKVYQKYYTRSHKDSRLLNILSKYSSPQIVAYYLLFKSGR